MPDLGIADIVPASVVPHASLPEVWRAVYWANPIAHYVRGQVANILHGRQVVCSPSELFHFEPEPGQTCAQYAGEWASLAGGAIQNPGATDMCNYCQYATGDAFLTSLNMPFNYRWTAFGVLLCFVRLQ